MSDSKPSGERSELTIVFEKSEQKSTISATGAFGGPTPDGAAIVANLFVEHTSMPNYVTHDIDSSGHVNMSKGKPVKRGDITREVQATLVMSPENAKQLGKWLIKNSEKAQENRSNNYD